MNLLRSLMFVPWPSMVTISTALLVWIIWWWADQAQTTIGPIILAFVGRLVFGPMLKLAQNPAARREILSHAKASTVVIGTCAAFSIFVLILNSERFVQISITTLSFIWGATLIWFALFSPSNLGRAHSGFNAAPQHISGINIIIGTSCVMSAFASAILMNIAPDAVWVAFMSVGQVIMLALSRWVAVMWILSLPDE